MEDEEPTAVEHPLMALMEKEEEEEPTDVVAPINGRNELKRLSDATKQDDDGESSTQCTLCGADYSHESLRRLLNQKSVQLKSPSNNRQPSSPFLRRHPPRSNDPLQVESTAAVLKLGITCGGCVAKISQIVSITEGVKEIVIDKGKETVTFKATLEVKKLSETLRRRPVMSVPGKQAVEYLQSQTDQYAGSELQQEMEKTQNDNIVRCDEDTSMHLGSEDGHQQDSSSLRLRGTKSDTKEWAWVVMSLLFEGLSATFDQLGYTLTGMVMAYVALLLFVVELTLKARRERLTWAVGTSLLPCFRRCSAHNNSRNVTFLVSVVELFGLASALWQCFYSTMQYKYTRWPSHNPIKSCLLPFLFVSCVFVSKFIREERNVKSGEMIH